VSASVFPPVPVSGREKKRSKSGRKKRKMADGFICVGDKRRASLKGKRRRGRNRPVTQNRS